jgi:L-fuconolactonase
MNESRRAFMSGMAALAVQDLIAQPASIPIIDAHIHLFDTTRPQGVPYPDKNNATLYQPALPERYRKIAQPLGVVGAIEIEASPWIEDNLWVLDVAAKDTIIVGTVGNLEPAKPEFPEYLERYHRNPLFRGIRYGNLWGRNIGAELSKPEFIAGLKLLADTGLARHRRSAA